MDLNEEKIEARMEAYLAMKEQSALGVFRQKSGAGHAKLPETVKSIVENAFLIGYGYGGIEYEDDLREVQKNDPIAFYTWIQEGAGE